MCHDSPGTSKAACEVLAERSDPDTAALIRALVAERDAAYELVATGAYEAALNGSNSIFIHAVALCMEKLRASEAERHNLKLALMQARGEVAKALDALKGQGQ